MNSNQLLRSRSEHRTPWLVAATIVLLLNGCSTTTIETPNTALEAEVNPTQFGLLIMAHGGNARWNADVADSVADLAAKYPVELAFGMADPVSIQTGINKLEARGVNAIGVVRLFISGESWYDRTAQILGLQEGAPPRPALAAHHEHNDDTAMNHFAMPLWRVETQSAIAMSEDGLSAASEMDGVLLSRMHALSQQPENENVVVIAHGPGDDAENARWIADINARLRQPQQQLNFNDIAVFTLREDWRDKREEAERQIRSYITQATQQGRDVIVIPYRIQGFGPYADVLRDLDYRADGVGLVPHENVTLWIDNQAQLLQSQLTTRTGVR